MSHEYKRISTLNVLSDKSPQNHGKWVDLFKEYNQKLIEIGYGMKRSELKRKNLIDIRPLYTDCGNVESYNVSPSMLNGKVGDITASEEFKSYFIKSAHFFAFVPCFETGVIQANKDRYIYFDIKELDLTSKKSVIYLQDFFMMGDGIWQSGVSGDLSIRESDDTENQSYDSNPLKQPFIEMSMHNIMLFPDIYRLIDQKTLGWSDGDMSLWEVSMIKIAERKLDSIIYETGHDSFEHLCHIFMHNIPVINYELYCNKPQPVRKQSTKTTKGIAVTDTAPKRITRMIGPIMMRSPKPPKLPTEESIRKYKVASWYCRGGMRTLKSGKVVPFKPSIHHRQCLKDGESNPMTQKLVFRSEHKEN